ncbi:hypothetical protein [Embleya sp. AB8]|uniref:hypothetical protein n=1 Tax=Embleya sp. AB8 TaxID=3156304 RepID=UPI003C756CC6
MRHSPESADDDHDTERLDARFQELVVQLAPQVPLPPVAGIHRAVRRRRVRNRVSAGAASLVVVAGALTLVRVGTADDDSPQPPQHRVAAPGPAPVSTPTRAPVPLSDALFPAPQEFPVVAGVYDNWRVADTRAALRDELGPCTTLTFSGLGTVEAQERVYNHDRQGGGLVVLVRYPDEHTAEVATTDLTGGLSGPCPSNQPNLAVDGKPRIKALTADGSAWRTQGIVNSRDQYVDYGVVRNGPVVAVVQETVIDPARVPPTDPFLRLVAGLRDRLGKNGSGP